MINKHRILSWTSHEIIPHTPSNWYFPVFVVVCFGSSPINFEFISKFNKDVHWSDRTALFPLAVAEMKFRIIFFLIERSANKIENHKTIEQYLCKNSQTFFFRFWKLCGTCIWFIYSFHGKIKSNTINNVRHDVEHGFPSLKVDLNMKTTSRKQFSLSVFIWYIHLLIFFIFFFFCSQRHQDVKSNIKWKQVDCPNLWLFLFEYMRRTT